MLKKYRRLALSILVFLAYTFVVHRMNFNAPPFIFQIRDTNRTMGMNKPLGNTNSSIRINAYNEKIKNILLWNALPGKMDSVLGTGRDGFIHMGCEYTNCFVSNDRSASSRRPIHSFDAIVFNMNVLHHSAQLPWLAPNYLRNWSQIFVFLSQEPPMYTWGQTGLVNSTEVQLYENFFNWSMSYRKDADVPFFYGSIKLLKSELNDVRKITPPTVPIEFTRIIRNLTTNTGKATSGLDRTSAVAWMVSHCPTHGHREDYIRQLKLYIKIDSYGKCGDLHIGDGDGGDQQEKSYNFLQSRYKFYLSFENSLCTDYVTEKFFWIMTRKMIPVVYGGADYSSIAPPHSYIDARLFEPKELADYLLMLDANETLYNEYFWWKDYYQVEAGPERMVKRGFCELCKKLHLRDDNGGNSIKIYDQIINHWLPDNQCEKPKTYSN